MTPRCWRCRGALMVTTDGKGNVVERCDRCSDYISRLEAWIDRKLEQRNRWNRSHYARHREREVARVRQWRERHRDKDRASSLRYYRKHREKINRRRRERARLEKRKAA